MLTLSSFISKCWQSSTVTVLLSWCLLLWCFTFSQWSEAQAFRQIILKHRDAEDVKRVIEPLLPEGSAITADNNSVLVNTSPRMINSVVKAIKSIDKPRKNLQLSIFRGKYPNKKGVITASTNAQVKQQQTVIAQEGQTVVMNEKGLGACI